MTEMYPIWNHFYPLHRPILVWRVITRKWCTILEVRLGWGGGAEDQNRSRFDGLWNEFARTIITFPSSEWLQYWLLEKSLGTPSVLQSTMTAVLAAGEILGTPSVLPSTMTAVLSAREMSRNFLCLTKYNDCSTDC